jgi:chemotaxis protein CheD
MPDYRKHYLYPAALYASIYPTIVSTLLGSCVAVCLYDPVKKFGGINHYMLPYWNGDGLSSPKFGNIAIKMLINKMLKQGSDKNNLIAKVFGGAAVLETKRQVFFIGERNINIAYELFEKEGIEIVAASTGGTKGRKILFNTFTGEVRQKYIEKVVSPGK